jgi:hypothetical protein
LTKDGSFAEGANNSLFSVQRSIFFLPVSMGSPLLCIFIPFTVPHQGHREKETVADRAQQPHTSIARMQLRKH